MGQPAGKASGICERTSLVGEVDILGVLLERRDGRRAERPEEPWIAALGGSPALGRELASRDFEAVRVDPGNQSRTVAAEQGGDERALLCCQDRA